ncbi:Uncharacterised protein [uncultured archaeon]|nr:Uncharacterised protein [uncultured archaeon]
MGFSLEKRAELKRLSERCADLLVDIAEENLPPYSESIKKDEQFKQIIAEIHSLCPSLSYSYMIMYKHIKGEKNSESNKWYHLFRKRNRISKDI